MHWYPCFGHVSLQFCRCAGLLGRALRNTPLQSPLAHESSCFCCQLGCPCCCISILLGSFPLPLLFRCYTVFFCNNSPSGSPPAWRMPTKLVAAIIPWQSSTSAAASLICFCISWFYCVCCFCLVCCCSFSTCRTFLCLPCLLCLLRRWGFV